MIWIILAVTLILQIIGNLILPGKPGYFRSDEWTDSEQFKIDLEEKNKGVIQEGAKWIQDTCLL